MALVSLTEASRLVHKDQSAISQDIERGVLGKTVLPDGQTRIDTAELMRLYGQPSERKGKQTASSNEKLKLALLEERTRSLERALALEAELRRAKDQLANELRARLTDKENMIKILENKILFLEYDRQIHDIPTLEQPEGMPTEHKTQNMPRRQRPAWWTRLFKRTRR
ncbi:MAG TPA: hypothetical protein VEC06_18000 [Paucimonas sp.]|nr:hypothetical protein [Paucimonas sp.]